MTFNHRLTRIGRLVAVFTIAISLLLGSAVPPAIAQDLPIPDPEFHGTITETYVYSEADESLLLSPAEPPEGAPNVVLVMLDDVGFGASETFGGPIHTPTLNDLATDGLSYNRFHTTAMCSPTRAALLTGRNHHSAASGIVTDFATGFPGYNGLIPQSTATVAKILQGHGYTTAWFGKNHNLGIIHLTKGKLKIKTFMNFLCLKSLILCLLIISFIFTISTPVNASPTDNKCPDGMVFIRGGIFNMGSDTHYESERSATDVTVDSFCIDRHEITNAEFRQFVEATGYQTIAERSLSKEQFPDLPDDQRQPGSLVFQPPEQGIQQVGYLSWWHWVVGANWQHPYGPNSNIKGKEKYPVVQVSYEDVAAYAKWAGQSLPTEAQWEYAARGGLDDADYSWGKQYSAKKANTWQGIFPFFNTKADGYTGTAPVGSFKPNGYGLYDITGNVWEWTSDWYSIGHDGKTHSSNPTGPSEKESFDPREPGVAKHVIKGGSYLCAPNYCSRYRPAARESQSPDTGTTHIGFRLIKNFTVN